MRSVSRTWRRSGLIAQFTMLGTLVMLIVFTVSGVVQSRWMAARLFENNVNVASIYMEGIVAPYVQELEHSETLSAESRRQLERIIRTTGLETQVEAIKVWLPSGKIAFATDKSLVGQVFEASSVERAVNGEVVVNLEEPEAHEDHHEPQEAEAVAEIYMPIRNHAGTVIAVGEFYQDAGKINASVVEASRGTWIVRIASGAVAIGALLLLVGQANRTINTQRRAIRRQHRRRIELRRENARLTMEAEIAHRNAMQSGEQLLSQIGADIHDGPIQVLTLAVLHSSSGDNNATSRGHADSSATGSGNSSVELIRDAIADLRRISSGLILPELVELSMDETIRLAVARHERDTGTRVSLHVGPMPDGCSTGLKGCVYRVIQEALKNAARHANGQGQRVEASYDGHAIDIVASDAGQGLKSAPDDGRPRLGLTGLRNRVRAFQGSFSVESGEERGTIVRARLPFREQHDGTSPRDDADRGPTATTG